MTEKKTLTECFESVNPQEKCCGQVIEAATGIKTHCGETYCSNCVKMMLVSLADKIDSEKFITVPCAPDGKPWKVGDPVIPSNFSETTITALIFNGKDWEIKYEWDGYNETDTDLASNCKRPEPKQEKEAVEICDRFGVPFKENDKVYDDEGNCLIVLETCTDEDDGAMVMDDRGTWWLAESLTHSPVTVDDARPIRINDCGYDVRTGALVCVKDLPYHGGSNELFVHSDARGTHHLPVPLFSFRKPAFDVHGNRITSGDDVWRVGSNEKHIVSEVTEDGRIVIDGSELTYKSGNFSLEGPAASNSEEELDPIAELKDIQQKMLANGKNSWAVSASYAVVLGGRIGDCIEKIEKRFADLMCNPAEKNPIGEKLGFSNVRPCILKDGRKALWHGFSSEHGNVIVEVDGGHIEVLARPDDVAEFIDSDSLFSWFGLNENGENDG